MDCGINPQFHEISASKNSNAASGKWNNLNYKDSNTVNDGGS